ncbi:MAG: DNA translocase FtsK [Oscillospiraceae bacterium]|nr:DNA translocase FtsK [Oscillospiraceae bacterium]
MAQPQRKKSSNNTRSNNSASKAAPKSEPQSAPRSSERSAAAQEIAARDKRNRQICSVVLFAVGLLAAAFALIPLEAPAWEAVRGGLHYVFGYAVYALGAALIYISLKRRIPLIVAIFALLCALLHIIGADSVESEARLGGVVGYGVSYPLMFFGQIGAGIIIGVVILVLVMVLGNITPGAFLRGIAAPFRAFGRWYAQRRELREQYAEELALLHEQELAEAAAAKSEAAYEQMKEAEREIEDKLGGSQHLEEKSKVEQFMKVLQEPEEEPEEDVLAPGEMSDDSDNTDEPPFDVEPDINDSDEPPFDVDSLDIEEAPPKNPVAEAIESYQKEKALEALQNELNENSVTASLDALEEEFKPEKPPSDFDKITALAEFAAHQQLYSLPSIDLLDNVVKKLTQEEVQAELDENAAKLVDTLKSFGVVVTMEGIIRGPSVTRYEIRPAAGVKISKITGLSDDIALNLAAAGVRMEAPIPGKSAVGVEIPNTTRDMVTFRELIDSDEFRKADSDSKLGTAIGRDITGEIIISDIAKMPHILIAGTTGSGKSVCVNSIIMSILYRATPEEVRIMMIDPKMVEFAIYSGIPHLLTPVVTDPKKAAGALGWAVNEMTRRYALFAENNVRNIGEFNTRLKNGERLVDSTIAIDADSNTEDDAPNLEYMAKIIIFIDELADLMMTAAKEVEGNICRLAQLARAAGIHLVIATQRPTTNVVTGLIKANIPSRIGLKVASQVDSRVIFDTAGAEKLLGNGDMLYAPTGIPKPIRVQGCWVSNDEINRVVKHVKESFDFEYDSDVIEEIERQTAALAEKEKGGDAFEDFELDDDRLDEAIEAVIAAGKASTSYLQLKLKLGYGRAARIMDIMEKMGVIGKSTGASRPREVLMTEQDWLERKLRRE